jgi:hypothetical protein
LSFGQLAAGWNYGSGAPAPRTTIDAALKIYSQLRDAGAEALEAFPETKGGILISGYHASETIDVLCRVDGRFNLFHEHDDREIKDSEGIDSTTVTNYFLELAWRPHRSFDSFTPNISAMKRTGSKVWRLKSQTMDVPLLMPPVRLKQVTANVHTFGHSTARQYPESLPFSSASTSALYRPGIR